MPKEDKMWEELTKIRELLTKPAPPPPKGMWNEFMDFISKYKVMGLAVACSWEFGNLHGYGF